MKKMMLLAGLIALPILANPVAAQTSPPAVAPFPPAAQPAQVTCSSELTRGNNLARAATDAKRKEMAQKHLDLAEEATKKNDERGCMLHAAEAIKALN